MNNIFEYVKDRVSIKDVISSYVDLKDAGRTTKGLCPFHNEKTPSFTVTEDKGFFHCFGCGESGDVISFIQKMEHLDSIDAVKFLADKYKIDLSSFNHSKRVDDREIQLMKDAARYYMAMLKHSNEARAYIEERGLNQDTLKAFAIGYAPDQWDGLYNALKGRYKPSLMLKLGLISSNQRGGYYDTFRHRLMFPIIDQRRRVVGFGGRVLDDSKPKYLNSQQSDIFNKSEILYGLNIAKGSVKEEDRLIVTEGYMDVVSLFSYGIKNVVGTLGTAFGKNHAELLARYTENVIFCLDSDTAGINGSLKAIDIAKPYIKHVMVATLEEGLDPDEYIKKYGKDGFLNRIDQAKPGVEFKIDRASKDFDLNDRNARADFYKLASGIIRQEKNLIDRTNYATYMVTQYGADEKTIVKSCGVYAVDQIELSNPSIKKPAATPKSQKQTFKPINPASLLLFSYIDQACKAENEAKRSEIFMEAFTMEFPEKYETILVALMDYFEEHHEEVHLSQFDFAALAELTGVEVAKDLKNLVDADKSDFNMDFPILLINYKLYRVENELKTLKKEGNQELDQYVRLTKEKQELIKQLNAGLMQK